MSLKNLLFGEEVKDNMRDFDPEISKLRRDSAGVFGKNMNALKDFNAGGNPFLKNQIAREQQGVTAASQDARRNLAQQVAARGLGNSSIGLGQESNLINQANQQKASIGASLGERQREEKLAGLNRVFGAANTGMQQATDRVFTPGGRRSGLLEDMAGAAIGGMGYGLGGAAGKGFGKLFGSN